MIEMRVGAAVTAWRGEREMFFTSFRLDNFCTVFQVEIVAIRRATKFAMANKKSINILSDSRSVLQAVYDTETLYHVAAEIQENIKKAQSTEIDMRLYWIKAHVAIAGNERTDELGKMAASENKRTPACDFFLLREELYYTGDDR